MTDEPRPRPRELSAAQLYPDRRAALARSVADPGFTPGRTDLPDVVLLLADDAAADAAERALLRAGAPAERALLARLPDARPPLRPRLVRALGRLASAPESHLALRTCLDDPDPKTRRNAIAALGKLGGPDTARELLVRARAERDLPALRSFVEALGKCGDADALAFLESLTADDPELRRLAERARLMLARTLGRDATPSALDLDVTAAHPIVLYCRAGLEPLLHKELGQGRPGHARIATELRAPLRSLLSSRLWTELGFPLPPQPRGPDLAADLVKLLTGPAARAIFSTYTKGQVRYRLAWQGGGHRRAVVWRLAADVAAIAPDLVNDPHASTWEVVVDDARGQLTAELRPRKLGDQRFAYRTGDVPAASHPTIAAALARLAGVRDDDIVWDPFVGSGLELCERGLLGRFAALHGSDLDPKALAVAAANLQNAGLSATLTEADALTHTPPRPTLIITNPPMGRRVHRGDVGPLLTAFIAHAASLLPRGGRLAWISPIPRTTDPAAQAAGLTLARALPVDMGGFTAQLQRWERR